MTETGARRRRRFAAPAAVAGLTVAAGAVLFVRDPRSSTYLPCPFHALTGLWCPGCGATRAFGDLVHGDVASAVSTNVLAVTLLVFGVLLWATWVRGRAVHSPPRWVVLFSALVVVLFTVVRNLPFGSALAP
ncbi:DUF2752 domain-containing protein [Rhodococcoides fascians]|uniref:DUF2752 domain-containing protein n=1 Tax=Rhodococcoides fascians TaxID=1828 RepID=UPI00056D577E|nr:MULTISPECIES: DUF2752 domain-containing protein [Rhodococcus]OZE99957.1 DUF2752 domain-containing protein [Rhodococcus sp. 15-1189-1-1a]OZF12536.1 DUF2752 domain-containing protein [Rhodococcus sp. 14-2686-1-2]